MKKSLLILVFLSCFKNLAFANHITGGQIFYTYLGQSGGMYQYHVSLNLYRDHFAPPGSAMIDPSAAIAIFDKTTGNMVWSDDVTLKDTIHLHLVAPSPCVTNPPTVWYEVGRYEFDISLPATSEGYIIAYQRCCRIMGINNLASSVSVGATYTAEIPGNGGLVPTAPENNSAHFIGSDTVIVCAGNVINYSFAAHDPDTQDQLSYFFCTAFLGGTSGAPSPNPPSPPPYTPVPYASPFSASSPLGPGVTLNTATGLISGVAPIAGIYVVTVCVVERRNGQIIATQRKDLQIKIGDCEIAKALLNPRPATCDGFTTSFQNDAPASPLIHSYFWDFGVGSLTNDTSNLANPTFTYPDTGVYIVKLITNRNDDCSDSATVVVRVFPGFFPGFTSAGICVTNPVMFTDTTKTSYGLVDSWHWDFGDATTGTDVSTVQNPQWTYATSGPKTIQLIVSNSKGCVDTAELNITVIDKPLITLAFKDTLICITDQVQLQASGTGVFSWTPLVNISNANTPTPTVSPTTTTWYYVNLNDNGCINTDSVRIRVVNGVTLFARGDTTICLTDAVQLNAQTDGLSFQWTPAATLNDPTIVNPIATPVDPITIYSIQAFIGSCSATDIVRVITVPYPVANAGPPAEICYNTSTQLNGSHDGSTFTWTPTSYLSDPTILNPVATPPRTTSYILTVFDTKGCPKPGRDTIVVKVRPKVRAFAGRDTTVVVGQPLFFNATGGVTYLWSPGTGLNSTIIHNPIGTYGTSIDSVRYKVIVADSMGCSDSAFVMVHVFKTNPYVFVPTAFTPNNDGRNDVLRPIAVGVQRINYFSIYNRWGERVFTTTVNGQGWDGKIDGTLQGTNTFVWMVSAIDYIGKPIFLKGTATLIR